MCQKPRGLSKRRQHQNCSARCAPEHQLQPPPRFLLPFSSQGSKTAEPSPKALDLFLRDDFSVGSERCGSALADEKRLAGQKQNVPLQPYEPFPALSRSASPIGTRLYGYRPIHYPLARYCSALLS